MNVYANANVNTDANENEEDLDSVSGGYNSEMQRGQSGTKNDISNKKSKSSGRSLLKTFSSQNINGNIEGMEAECLLSLSLDR